MVHSRAWEGARIPAQLDGSWRLRTTERGEMVSSRAQGAAWSHTRASAT